MFGTTQAVGGMTIAPGGGNGESKISLLGGGGSGYGLEMGPSGDPNRGAFTFDAGSKFFTFKIDGSDKVRITQNGSVGIGTTSPSYQLQLSSNSAAKPGGGSWSDSSDIRLKENIRTINNALSKIMQLRGVTFDWKNETEQGKKGAGFIADEVMLVFPNWVKEVKSSNKQKEIVNDDKIKSLNFPFEFDALLVEAIKELKAENEELKKRIENLESK